MPHNLILQCSIMCVDINANILSAANDFPAVKYANNLNKTPSEKKDYFQSNTLLFKYFLNFGFYLEHEFFEFAIHLSVVLQCLRVTTLFSIQLTFEVFDSSLKGSQCFAASFKCIRFGVIQFDLNKSIQQALCMIR